MGLSSAEELGRRIAQGLNKTEQLKEDVFASDETAAMLLAPYDRIKLTQTVTGIAFPYGSECFILDHPVYGELDSSTLELDCGYLPSAFPMSFPLVFGEALATFTFTFPITFGTGTANTTTLFTYTS